MKDDYLWDGSGEPDPEVQKLEKTLGRYRHNQPAPQFDQVAETPKVKRPWNFFDLSWEYQLGAVAAVCVLAVTTFLFMRQRSTGNLGPSWEVARLEGAPRVGWHALGEKSGPGKLRIGQTLVTDSSSRASITLDETGRVEVDPGSRLRLVDARKNDALTLWHLLSRVSDADRPGLYDRLAGLAPPPEGVTREGILRLDRQMLDAWWSSFGFGDIHLWRTYERDWSQP